MGKKKGNLIAGAKQWTAPAAIMVPANIADETDYTNSETNILGKETEMIEK